MVSKPRKPVVIIDLLCMKKVKGVCLREEKGREERE